MNNLYRLFAVRLGLAATVIALLLGGAAYLQQQSVVARQVVALAAAEARDFIVAQPEGMPELLRLRPAELERRLEGWLEGRAAGADGHFAVAELYDRRQRPIAEAARAEAEALEAAIDETAHAFPEGAEPWHDKVSVDGGLFMRVVVPLTDAGGARHGFFEGVYRVSDARRAAMMTSAARTVGVVVVVVCATTLFLVPVIVALNRHLVELSRKLLRSNLDTLGLLGDAIAKRDSDTHAHNYRVTLYALGLAEAIELDRAAIQDLIKGAFLHDVGKIAIPDGILLKPGRLDADEFAVMKTHVDHGVDIIRRSEWLAGANPVVRHHHEKFDGSGYPDGLSGQQIPIVARIFAIADVFDALTSKRPYKEAMPFERAMAILRDGRGSHFDPDLLDAFERIARPAYETYGKSTESSVATELADRAGRYFGV